MGRDFRVLWGAYSLSELGSAVGMGALPLVAIVVLHASAAEVTGLAAVAGVTAALVTLPLGPWVEYQRKRPVMIGADVVRFAALVSVPAATAAGALSVAQLYVVATVQVAATIVFGAASGAHLKGLVPAEHRARAASWLEGSMWSVNTVGPALGGLLISLFGATVSLVVDAVSYLLSAVGIRALRAPEPPCPVRTPTTSRATEMSGGWGYLRRDPVLRALFANSVVFGGCITASTPLLALMMLRDLSFTPVQYGLALGLPCLGGVGGAILVRALRRKLSERLMLLATGTARCLWLGLIPLAATGRAAFGVVLAAETLLLLCAGMFNPTFSALRLQLTDDHYLARVLAFWSTSTKLAQPAFIAAAGALASAIGVRPALAVLAGVLLASSALLPWRSTTVESEESTVDHLASSTIAR